MKNIELANFLNIAIPNTHCTQKARKVSKWKFSVCGPWFMYYKQCCTWSLLLFSKCLCQFVCTVVCKLSVWKRSTEQGLTWRIGTETFLAVHYQPLTYSLYQHSWIATSLGRGIPNKVAFLLTPENIQQTLRFIFCSAHFQLKGVIVGSFHSKGKRFSDETVHKTTRLYVFGWKGYNL